MTSSFPALVLAAVLAFFCPAPVLAQTGQTADFPDLGYFRSLQDWPVCEVEVSIGGYGGRILSPQEAAEKQASFNQLVALLKSDPAIKSVGRLDWGKEGEKSYCISLVRADQACALVKRIKQVMPQSAPLGPKHTALNCP